MRTVGTVARGIRAPLIKSGDDLAKIVVESVIAASDAEGFPFRDKDVIGITEAIVARAQGNYANTDQIAADIRRKFPDGEVGLIFPILSRNRFGNVLKEGPVEDFSNREEVAKLLRFASTRNTSDAQDVSLTDYIAKMPEKQKCIYYLVSGSYASAATSPA